MNACIVESRSLPIYDAGRSASQIQQFVLNGMGALSYPSISSSANLPAGVYVMSLPALGVSTKLRKHHLYAIVKANLAITSLVEQNESAAVPADLVQLLGDLGERQVSQGPQPFGTAHARLASGKPAQMSDKVRGLARKAVALRAVREKNPEDPHQWAERITKNIYGE
ncbi:hypothetical protein [Paraburkholderia phenoliruptrix]|uniref:hypothetical protein n=1 Tax=Paraburkholderia phenoliruptrix TaxID=252970 RepID=UPI003D99416C